MEFAEVKGLDENIHKYCPDYIIFIYIIDSDSYYILAQCTNESFENEDLFSVSKDTYNKLFSEVKDPIEIYALDLVDLADKLLTIRSEALNALRPIGIELNLEEKIPKYLRDEK